VAKDERRVLIAHLDESGLFATRNAASHAARALGVSRATVYTLLKEVRVARAERLERRKHYTSICCSAPSEQLATIALTAAERILTRNRAIVAENVPLFESFFNAWGERFAWESPQGGCVSFPRLLTGETTTTFCRRLVETAGVLLLPPTSTPPSWRPSHLTGFGSVSAAATPGPALEALGTFLESER
jgi:aspartate/methionine/tyrosine aminotransferase